MRVVQIEGVLQGQAEVTEFVLGLRVVLVKLDALDGAAVVGHQLCFERVERRVRGEANNVVEQRDVKELEVHADPPFWRAHENGVGK